jgi:hypothetical protein
VSTEILKSGLEAEGGLEAEIGKCASEKERIRNRAQEDESRKTTHFCLLTSVKICLFPACQDADRKGLARVQAVGRTTGPL